MEREGSRKERGLSYSWLCWEYQAGWDEDNMTDQGMNSSVPLRRHTSDCRQRRTAVEQLVSHENPQQKGGLREERESAEEKECTVDCDVCVMFTLLYLFHPGKLNMPFRVCFPHSA